MRTPRRVEGGSKIWPTKGLSKNLALALVAAHAKGNSFQIFWVYTNASNYSDHFKHGFSVIGPVFAEIRPIQNLSISGHNLSFASEVPHVLDKAKAKAANNSAKLLLLLLLLFFYVGSFPRRASF